MSDPVVETATVAAATAGQDQTVDIVAPYDGTITAVHVVPVANLTGANTESRTVKVVNRGQAGAGTAQAALLAFVSGVKAFAGHEKTITLSSTAADLVVAAGDVLRVTSLHIGSTGLAAPALEARIRFAPAVAASPSGLAPRVESARTQVAAAAQAVDVDGGYVEAPFDGTVTAVSIIAEAAITGANTDSRTVQVFNRGQAGSGTTKVAEKAFVSTVNAAADDETAITLSGTAANLNVVKGDVLEFVSLHVGDGLAGPAFTGEVEFTR